MATAQITPTTVSAMRKVFAALEDNFDAEKGEYLHGYSDERIAKETGISVDGVKKYRIDGFGKLRPPSELDTLKRWIGEAKWMKATMRRAASGEKKTKYQEQHGRMTASVANR